MKERNETSLMLKTGENVLSLVFEDTFKPTAKLGSKRIEYYCLFVI